MTTKTSEGLEAPARDEARPRTAPVQARAEIRRIRPWSVLKFSLIFYFCLMLVFMFAMVIVYWILGVTGVLKAVSDFLTSVGFTSASSVTFKFSGTWIFERLFLVGLAGVILWSFVNTLVAVLYNLISDAIGGIEVTLSDRR